jgi:hypothetical protein
VGQRSWPSLPEQGDEIDVRHTGLWAGAVIRPRGQARSFDACSGGERRLRRIGYFGEKDRGSAPVKLIPSQNARFTTPLTCKKASDM